MPSRSRRCRSPRSLCLLVWILTTLALIEVPGTARAALPPQGVYEQCGPGRDEPECLGRLEQIRAAGFTFVLNYMQWYGGPEQIERYADRAQQLGLKLIYPLNAPAWTGDGALLRTYRELAAQCPCSDDETFRDWAIGLVSRHSSTWGWYVGDEVDPAREQSVQALSRRVHALDPVHPRLYVAYENSVTNGANLRPFATVADVLGADYYPIGTPFGPEAIGDIAEKVQQIADAGGRGAAVVLQSFSWDQYPHSPQVTPRWPSRLEMLRQRDMVLARSRPALMLWYSYFDVARSEDPARHLEDLRQAAFAPEPPHELEDSRGETPPGAGTVAPPPPPPPPVAASGGAPGSGVQRPVAGGRPRVVRAGPHLVRRRCRGRSGRKRRPAARRPTRCRRRATRSRVRWSGAGRPQTASSPAGVP